MSVGDQWESYGTSVEQLGANSHFSFEVPFGAAGVYVSLTPAAGGLPLMNITFSRGTVRTAVPGGGDFLHTPPPGAVYRLLRRQDTIYWLIDSGQEEYTHGLRGELVTALLYPSSTLLQLRVWLGAPGDSIDRLSLNGVDPTSYNLATGEPTYQGTGGTGGTLHFAGQAARGSYGQAAGQVVLLGAAAEYTPSMVSGSMALVGASRVAGTGGGHGAAELTGFSFGGLASLEFFYASGAFPNWAGSAVGRGAHPVVGGMSLWGSAADFAAGSAYGEVSLAGAGAGAQTGGVTGALELRVVGAEYAVEQRDIMEYARASHSSQLAESIQHLLRALASADTVTQFTLLLRERATVQGALRTFRDQDADFFGLVGAAQVLLPVFTANLSLGVEIEGGSVGEQVLRLVDRLRAEDSSLTMRQRFAVATSIVLARAIDRAGDGVWLEDSLTADLDEELALRLIAIEAETLLAEVQALPAFGLSVRETLTVDAADTVQGAGHYLAAPMLEAGAQVVFRLGDEVLLAWVMNTDGQRPLSEYTNYDFNSFCRVGDTFFAASDKGIFTLGGPDDAGEEIAAMVRTMVMDFGTGRQKRVKSAYLGYTAARELVLKVRSVEDGQMMEQLFAARPMGADAPDTVRMEVGLGMRSRYWQFELVNVDGADFEVDTLELYPLTLGRRV